MFCPAIACCRFILFNLNVSGNNHSAAHHGRPVCLLQVSGDTVKENLQGKTCLAVDNFANLFIKSLNKLKASACHTAKQERLSTEQRVKACLFTVTQCSTNSLLSFPSPSLPFHSLPLCLPTVAFLPFLSGEPSDDSISLWVISALSWKLGYGVSDRRPVGPRFSSRAALSNVHSGLLQADLMRCDTSVMSCTDFCQIHMNLCGTDQMPGHVVGIF